MKRPGVTLMETLIAIFVVAIALLGLLALFVVGTAHMGQALKDSRVAQAAQNAASIAEFQHVRNDSQALLDPITGLDVFMTARGAPPAAPMPPRLDQVTLPGGAAYDGPSYPIYVDPFGWGLSQTLPAILPAGVPNAPIPRQTVSFVEGAANPSQAALQHFALLDGLSFGPDGTPTTSGGTINRDVRHTWAYMLRRPRWNDSLVNLTIVVYEGRSLNIPPIEDAYGPVTWDPTSSTVTVTWAAPKGKPPIRPGGWVLDATMVDASVSPPLPDPHGFFYRVVAVTETLQAGQPALLLELQERPRSNGGQTAHSGPLIVLDGVAEVFEKGVGRGP